MIWRCSARACYITEYDLKLRFIMAFFTHRLVFELFLNYCWKGIAFPLENNSRNVLEHLFFGSFNFSIW